MRLRMWMYDLAREQCPTYEHLRQMAEMTEKAGYNAWGIYLEHRFAYPSTPWSHGVGAVEPEVFQRLQKEFPNLQIIPFVNLLGHFEGMMYTEEGKQYREELFTGLQACPANPNFVALCKKLIDDVLATFSSELIHIGGDETAQLGASEASKSRIEALRLENPEIEDGKALLYGHHFGPLADYVASQGRRPAIWGDMLLEHPDAAKFLPKNTLIFDWQYFQGLQDSTPKLQALGFEIVGSPAIQTYNATWCHLDESEKNVREVAKDVVTMGLDGVCITTWECGLFGSYDTILPALEFCGKILASPDSEGTIFDAYEAVSPAHRKWAEMMSRDLGALGGSFTPGRIRNSLKTRLLLMGNPFLAWLHHGEEFSGEHGDKVIEHLNHTLQVSPGEAESGITLFARGAVEFIQMAEMSRLAYARGRVEEAIAALSPTRKLFDDLANVARRTHTRIGGSLADVERCKTARRHVEIVMQRLREFGDGSLGYLPAYEHITNHKFMPHDQAAWWLINKWANQ